MIKKDFIPQAYAYTVDGQVFSYESPSNIALIKYWGKYGDQLPKNPSLSFTLAVSSTTTHLHIKKLEEPVSDFSFEVLLDGEPKPKFEPKIQQFLERIEEYLPFLKSYHFKIETSNSFPHSSGIASSASGMSALALCLMEVERTLLPTMSPEYFNTKASFLSRLGSGSACRSLQGPLVVWGEHVGVNGSSDLYGSPYTLPVHGVFKDFQDTILLVDTGEKQVSSTVGHNLMLRHPYADARFEQAHQDLADLINVLEKGDLDTFMALVEREALALHAMMMTSRPYFILMKPNTLEIINAIWEFRHNTGNPVCFTLDAGANVHVLYPASVKVEVMAFIKNTLTPYCQDGKYICDAVGFGAKKL
ncbi:MAG: diphosphomevalonate decarboxylase [Leeuwenhoekiella sp.]